MKFDLNELRKVNDEASDFDKPVIMNGVADFKVERMTMKEAGTNGTSTNIAISPLEGEFKERWCWISFNIYDRDSGDLNAKVFKVYLDWLKKLSNSMWSLDDWDSPIDDDSARQAAVNANLAKFEGSTFNGSIETIQNGEYTNYRVKFKRLLDSKYSAGKIDESTLIAEQQHEETAVKLVAGQAISYVTNTGQQAIGKVVTLIEPPDENTEGQIIVSMTDGSQVPVAQSKVVGILSAEDVAKSGINADVTVSPAAPEVIEEDTIDLMDDLLPDEESSPAIKLEKGTEVKVKNKAGEIVEGKIHSINEDTGSVKVAVPKDGKMIGVNSTLDILRQLNS